MPSTSSPVCAAGGAATEQELLRQEERNVTGFCLQALFDRAPDSPLPPGGVVVLGIRFSA